MTNTNEIKLKRRTLRECCEYLMTAWRRAADDADSAGQMDRTTALTICAAQLATALTQIDDVPRWLARPDRPGRWVCVEDAGGWFPPQPTVRRLTQSDIDKGKPFHTVRVYGPIPAEPKA